jgi:hypothetical protein
LAAGIPAKVMSERLGHADISITLDTYSHVLPGMDAAAANVVADLILGTAEGNSSSGVDGHQDSDNAKGPGANPGLH